MRCQPVILCLFFADWKESHMETATLQCKAVLHEGEWDENCQISCIAASGESSEPLPHWRFSASGGERHRLSQQKTFG